MEHASHGGMAKRPHVLLHRGQDLSRARVYGVPDQRRRTSDSELVQCTGGHPFVRRPQTCEPMTGKFSLQYMSA